MGCRNPDIVGCGKGFHQLIMLVNHTDFQTFRVFGRVYDHRLPVNKNLTAVGFINARQHVHQSGLAGTVFAQKGQNLAFISDQINAVIGKDCSEYFGDASQFDGSCFFFHIQTLLGS